MRKNRAQLQVIEKKIKSPIDKAEHDSLMYESEMKRKMLNKGQLIALMKKRQGNRSTKDFAAEIGVAPSYISQIYLGRMEPGKTVLAALGVTRQVMYVAA